MTADSAIALLELVAANEGISAARICKRLALSRSELQRLLARLGPDENVGGRDLIRLDRDAGRDTLWLTESARALRSR